MDIFGTGVGGAQPHSIAFGGVFPHYKGDLNTTKFTTKRQILAENDQFNAKTPPQFDIVTVKEIARSSRSASPNILDVC